MISNVIRMRVFFSQKDPEELESRRRLRRQPFKISQIQFLTTIAYCNIMIAICNVRLNTAIRYWPTTISLRVRGSVRGITELWRSGARIDRGLHSQCL